MVCWVAAKMVCAATPGVAAVALPSLARIKREEVSQIHGCESESKLLQVMRTVDLM